MILVVSDSSPLNFLIRLGCVEILPTLFGHVLIPPAVETELTHASTPAPIRALLASRPGWPQVRAPVDTEHIPKLDAGEIAAICLAREVGADLVLLDDGDARKAAASRGLRVIGLLGILERADQLSLMDLNDVAGRLPDDYRIDRALVDDALERRRRRTEPPR